jgi:hypothetical protein
LNFAELIYSEVGFCFDTASAKNGRLSILLRVRKADIQRLRSLDMPLLGILFEDTELACRENWIFAQACQYTSGANTESF